MNNPKQVIVMRKDLKMRKGKMVAQGSHGSIGSLLSLGSIEYQHHSSNNRLQRIDLVIPLYVSPNPDEVSINRPFVLEWLQNSFTKICVGVDSEEELLLLHKAAIAEGIPNALITDEGRTEFNGVPTNTCLAIGPDLPETIDRLTGHLKLL